jgi:hypothetical protein
MKSRRDDAPRDFSHFYLSCKWRIDVLPLPASHASCKGKTREGDAVSFLRMLTASQGRFSAMTSRQLREGNAKYQEEVLQAMLAEKHNKGACKRAEVFLLLLIPAAVCADCGTRGPTW